MKTLPFRILAASAVLATTSAQAAPAKPCLTRPEMLALVLYVTPKMIETVASKCASALPRDAYLLTVATDRARDIRANRTPAFAAAKSAFAKFGGKSGEAGAKVLASLPEATITSIIEDGLAEELTSEIKTSSCVDIDRIARPLAPLPTDNLVDFLTETFLVASRGDRRIGACPGA